jgi:predicted AAA+ superfamily ATPase
VWGGFFEVVDARSEEERRRIVQTYLDLVVYKDVVERYGVKNVAVMKRLIRYFVTNTTRKASLLRLSQTLAERVSKNTVHQYTGLLEDCGFLFPVRKFSHSLRRGNTPSKYYVADPCFKAVAGLNFSEDRGALYENAVLLELIRRGDEPFFYEEKGECDFVVKRGPRIVEALQVCLDPKGKERERRGLVAAMAAFKLDSGTVITAEQEGEEAIDGKTIRFVPLWRWLLAI